jgi:hypothetical protein
MPEDKCISEKYVTIHCGESFIVGELNIRVSEIEQYPKRWSDGDRNSLEFFYYIETFQLPENLICWRDNNSLKCWFGGDSKFYYCWSGVQIEQIFSLKERERKRENTCPEF